jgi:hypothetical protein
VIDAVHAADGAKDTVAVGNVTEYVLDGQTVEMIGSGSRANQASNALASFDKGSNQMPSDEPTSACHKVERHGPKTV